MGVLIMPGAMQFTRMPCGPNVPAISRVMPARPALAAAYAGWRAPAARMPTIEVMFTMDPPSCSSMTGIAALQSMNGAVRFTAIVSSYCSRLVSMMSPSR